MRWSLHRDFGTLAQSRSTHSGPPRVLSVVLLLGAGACGGVAGGSPGASAPGGAGPGADLPVCAAGVVAADPRLAERGLLTGLASTLSDEGWTPTGTEVVEAEAPAVLANSGEVGRTLEEIHRRDLLERRLSGSASVLALVDAEGVVAHRRLEVPSPQGPINLAAVEVVDGMEFQPAVHRGCRLPWVTLLPVSFTLR